MKFTDRCISIYYTRSVVTSFKQQDFTLFFLLEPSSKFLEGLHVECFTRVCFNYCTYFFALNRFYDQFNQVLLKRSTSFSSVRAIHALSLLDTKLCARNYNFSKHILVNFAIFSVVSYNFFSLFIVSIIIAWILQSGLKTILIIDTFYRRKASILPLNLPYLKQWNYLQNVHFYMLEQFPIYTILVPLYLEPQKLRFIMESIAHLTYPKSRLDVKLVIEADDLITQKELSLINMLEYFQVIKVPPSLPRTKPKALNYAAQYIHGQYLVIFDAEDRPDPAQLIKSLQAFNKLDEGFVCLQAKLNFYNKNENMLTMMQSIEYFVWFGYLLPGLASIAQFVPLGGTSCYFKANILKKIGFWDAFNVTEDLDLGIRLHLKGYKTFILDSTTLEEAVVSIPAWMNQRARWIKGFMQSYIVFCANRSRFDIKLKHKFIIDIFVGMSIFNFLIPIYFFLIPDFGVSIKFGVHLSSAISIIYLIGCAIIALAKQQKDKEMNNLGRVVNIIIFPFYFILHTFAAYVALYQLITSPFAWNKTVHGISRIVK